VLTGELRSKIDGVWNAFWAGGIHGVDDPDIRYKDSLAQEHAGDSDRYSLVLANPPFAKLFGM
jgi:type I restriction-modification system DNA methylase subunit